MMIYDSAEEPGGDSSIDSTRHDRLLFPFTWDETERVRRFGTPRHWATGEMLNKLLFALTADEMERVRRFGTPRHWMAGEMLIEAGHPVPGLILMLSGAASVARRDGLGRSEVVAEHCVGHFVGDVGQLSGQHAIVDVAALEPIDGLVIPPDQLRALINSEAELGGRILRTLILRRIAAIDAGAGPMSCPQRSINGTISPRSPVMDTPSNTLPPP